MRGKDKLRQLLDSSGGNICDDCLQMLGGWSARQTTRAVALRLEAGGVVSRRSGVCSLCLKNKIITVAIEDGVSVAAGAEPALQDPGFRLVARPVPSAVARPEPTTPASVDRSWYWEGNVQSVIAGYLAAQGYRLRQVANTSTRETGVDVIAEKAGRELWVTVKGYPQGTSKTNPSTQSRHWFSHAVFDVVLYRSRDAEVDIAVGLPDGFTTYLNLASRVGWLKERVPFAFLWVGADGGVREE